MGYAHSVDWWTVGVLLYELCCGRSPFYDPRTIAMYERISAGVFRFPPALSQSYMNLVSNILSVKVDARLGCLKSGAKDIRAHEWFDGFDWIAVYEGAMVPPMQPVLAGSDDSRYFDKYEEKPIVIAAKPEFEAEFRDF
jgi:serine/threonine protein kinase